MYSVLGNVPDCIARSCKRSTSRSYECSRDCFCVLFNYGRLVRFWFLFVAYVLWIAFRPLFGCQCNRLSGKSAYMICEMTYYISLSSGTITLSSPLASNVYTSKCYGPCWSNPPFLPERDYVTFGSLLSQFRLSSVCRLSVCL